jgi:hypothetical protein
MDECFYVYQYLREDASPYYIGKGKGRRAWRHSKGEVLPPRDKTRVVILAHKLTEIEAYSLKMKLISLYGRKDLGTGILHNKTDGGGGPTNVSMETREKQSKANKGKVTPEEVKNKISKAKTGQKRKPFSESWKNAMSKAKIGKKGRPLSEETKEKIRKAQTGKKVFNGN